MFERFSERARQVVVLAQEEARTLKHNHIGTEHILLGLLREGEGIAACVLESLGITTERARVLVAPGEEVASAQIPFTPRGKRVLEASLREALGLGHNYIGTEHILLALVRENDGIAARILLDFDADPEKVRNEVRRILSIPPVSRRSLPREILTGIDWDMAYAYVLVHARKIRVCLKRGDYGAALDEARNVTSMLERLA